MFWKQIYVFSIFNIAILLIKYARFWLIHCLLNLITFSYKIIIIYFKCLYKTNHCIVIAYPVIFNIINYTIEKKRIRTYVLDYNYFNAWQAGFCDHSPEYNKGCKFATVKSIAFLFPLMYTRNFWDLIFFYFIHGISHGM